MVGRAQVAADHVKRGCWCVDHFMAAPEMFPESVQDADVIKVGSIWIPGS